MERNTAIILVLILVIACACPGLICFGSGGLAALGSQVDPTTAEALPFGLLMMCLGGLAMAIPLVAGIVVWRMSTPPAPVTPPPNYDEDLPPAI